MHIINIDESRKINVSGIDNHTMNNLDVVTAGAYIKSNKGPVIGIFHQYANVKSGKSIHSSGQLEHYKADVNDKSLKVGGLQRITTLDGYSFPLDIIQGLAFLQLRPYMDAEFADASIPHVVMISDTTWDPGDLDCTISTDSRWHDTVTDVERKFTTPFDEFGNYHQRHGNTVHQIHKQCLFDVNAHIHDLATQSILVNERNSNTADRDYESLRQFFLWKDVDMIKHTYDNTTQYAR